MSLHVEMKRCFVFYLHVYGLDPILCLSALLVLQVKQNSVWIFCSQFKMRCMRICGSGHAGIHCKAIGLTLP